MEEEEEGRRRRRRGGGGGGEEEEEKCSIQQIQPTQESCQAPKMVAALQHGWILAAPTCKLMYTK